MAPHAANAIAERVASVAPEAQPLLFRRGFLIATTPQTCPAYFHQLAFPIFVALHCDTTYGVALIDGFYVCLIGLAVDPDEPQADLTALACKIAADPDHFQTIVDRFVGRFVLLQGRVESGFQIQTDAIGMRFTCVLPIEGGFCACSHQNLAAHVFDLTPKPAPYMVRFGRPGIETDFEGVLRLSPNVNFNLKTGQFERFFPFKPLPATSLQDAWGYAMQTARKVLSGYGQNNRLLFSLTAGFDSRTTLASIDPELRAQSRYFCYDTGVSSTQVDIAISQKIAARMGLDLVQFKTSELAVSQAVMRGIGLNSFATHGHRISAAYHALFGAEKYIHVRTKLFEIARATLYKHGHKTYPEGPDTPLCMAQYYKAAIPAQSPEAIPTYEAAFQRYHDICTVGQAVAYASAWDIYFVEHRMGAWHSNIVLESDVGFDTIIAFNSRNILAHFWGVPEAERVKSHDMRKHVFAPLHEITDIPINPKEMPQD